MDAGQPCREAASSGACAWMPCRPLGAMPGITPLRLRWWDLRSFLGIQGARAQRLPLAAFPGVNVDVLAMLPPLCP